MSHDHALSAQDAGRTIEVEVGDVLRVELTENPTIGYRWAREPDQLPGLRLRDNSFQLDPDAAIGAPGVRRFEYVVERPGDSQLCHRCAQAWKDEDAFAERFCITIVASE